MAKTDITAELIRERLNYDKDTGIFTWRTFQRHPSKVGKVAGGKDAHGYLQLNIGGSVLKVHRLAWFYVHGEWPSSQLDHINHDRSDNRIENLRLVDNRSNHKNRPLQKNNSTGMPGVWFDKKRKLYSAYITVDGKRVSLGCHKTLESAKAARQEANIRYGFHKNHGEGMGRCRAAPLPHGQRRRNALLIDLDGASMLASEWEKQDGVTATAGMIRARIRSGWDARAAIFTPFVTGRQRAEKRQRMPNGVFAAKCST